MANGLVRTNINTSASDVGIITSTEQNAYSGAKKTLSVGPDFKKSGTNAYVSGNDFSAGGSITPWTTMWIYNNSSLVGWVALSTATIASAPTSFSSGVPIAPNSWLQLAAGENSFIYTSANTVGVYIVNDDTRARIINP